MGFSFVCGDPFKRRSNTGYFEGESIIKTQLDQCLPSTFNPLIKNAFKLSCDWVGGSDGYLIAKSSKENYIIFPLLYWPKSA